MKKSPSNNEVKKTTSEKPVSLSPLDLKEALNGLLGIKPKEVEEQKNKEEQASKE